MLASLLIKLVRERRAIYDPSDPLHRDRDVIAALWKDIAAEMQCPEAKCKEKWHQLRSNFMREKRTISCQPPGSAIKTKTWVFYESMLFLSPFVKSRAPTSTSTQYPIESHSFGEEAPDDSASDNAPYQETPANLVVCEWGSGPAVNQPTSTSEKLNANKRLRYDCPNEGEAQTAGEDSTSQYEDDLDPDRQFLLSLLPHMKQLSPSDAIDIKIEILQAFRRKLFKDTDPRHGHWCDQSHTPAADDTVNHSENYP